MLLKMSSSHLKSGSQPRESGALSAALTSAAVSTLRPGRHRHSTLTLTVIGCYSVGIHTLILLSLLSFSVKMTVSPMHGHVYSALRTKPHIMARTRRASIRNPYRRWPCAVA